MSRFRPRNFESGTVLSRSDERQVLVGRHKAKLQALVAVARKMLHAIFGMFRWRTHYDGSRLLPNLELPTLTATA
jgi:hypothetical protein